MYNNLRAAYEPVVEALAETMDAEGSRTDAYTVLADAIIAGNSADARAAADSLLRPATETLLAAFTAIEETS